MSTSLGCSGSTHSELIYIHSFLQAMTNYQFSCTIFQVPSYYVWKGKTDWVFRLIGQDVPEHPGIKFDEFLRRVYTIHSSQHEYIYLHLILLKFRDPTSFQNLTNVKWFVRTMKKHAWVELCFKMIPSAMQQCLRIWWCNLMGIFFALCRPIAKMQSKWSFLSIA